MPLSFGILLGMLIAFSGAVLYFASAYKRLAKVLVGIGLAISLVIVVIIALAVNSSM